VVPTDTPGFSTQDIHGKLSLRASVTSELLLDDVRLPASAMLPEARGLGGPLTVLGEARLGIVFGAAGAARACLEAAVDYARTREQFGRPIGAFQLTQGKLAEMASRVAAMQLLALRLGRMKEAGTLTPEHVSLGKYSNVASALEVARMARTILGGNGITLEYPVMRHGANLETVLTYEGTHEVHALVLGRALTGLQAFS
jgi:glutaryl-CoA dehydrogenase